MNISPVGFIPVQQKFRQNKSQNHQVSFGMSINNLRETVKYPLPRKIGAIFELLLFSGLHAGQKAVNFVLSPIEVHIFGEDPKFVKQVDELTLDISRSIVDDSFNILRNRKTIKI